MYFKEYHPNPSLSRYIDSYFEIDTSKVHEDITALIVPDGTFGLLFIDSDSNIRRNLITANPPITLCKTAVFGQKTKPINYFYRKGEKKAFGVKINPAGLTLFLNDKLTEFKNLFVEIDQINNIALLDLEYKVLQAKTIQEKIEIIEEHITKNLAVLIQNKDFHLFSLMVDFIKESKGLVKFDLLIDQFNTNYKKIERLFNHFLGITPKAFIRIIRFNASIHVQSNAAEMNLTQLGYKLGFYDQSHFIREFKSFTSLTPKEFFSKPLCYSEKIHLKLISSRW